MDLDATLGADRAPLTLHQVDLERRLGVPAGRFTHPGPVLPLLLSGAATGALFAALRLLPPNALTVSLTQRGWIPVAIVLAATWALALLWVKTRKLAAQRRALDLRLGGPRESAFTLTPGSADLALERLYVAVDDPRGFLLTRRIHDALSNLRNVRRIGDVDEVLRAHAARDEAATEASYNAVHGILWALPVLGFIGTVLGLSQALGSFGEVLDAAADVEALRAALRHVTAGLSTAFETTLQGLLASVFVHAVAVWVRGREDRLLQDCEEYCLQHVVRRLRLSEDT